MAHKLGRPTAWGTLLDITFDRLVEIGIILSTAVLHPEASFWLLILMSSILISMTVFLTVGALAEKKGIKSFYYQAGIMERTEGFIFFSLMLLLPNYLKGIALTFAVLIFITALQHISEGKKILKQV
ncbi:MAG: hypothetical protein H0Z36_05495 [Thermosyntropha sp.]|nr:hypothetical protein [Thermosyntropha sp.]MBO8158994.1 hypothetical protein [Thermosyntropha sp.]